MNCDKVRQHWELYYDSEGDSELYLQINEHLADCPRCAKWLFQQGQFEELVSAQLTTAEPTAKLWEHVLSETGLTRPVAARGWMFFSPFLALAASVLLIVGMWQFPSRSASEHLSDLTAVVHKQLADGSERIEFSSLSDEEIERYLKKRVSFPVRCPPRKDAGFVVRGGGVCEIAGELAAYVAGQVDNQDVSIFIIPVERLAQFAYERDVLSREVIHHCRCQGGEYDIVLAKIDHNVVVVIGRGSPDKLERVVRAYGTYPHESA